MLGSCILSSLHPKEKKYRQVDGGMRRVKDRKKKRRNDDEKKEKRKWREKEKMKRGKKECRRAGMGQPETSVSSSSLEQPHLLQCYHKIKHS